ncbi:hypothetical protein BB560_006238 [Smittium megazygosporum]|uniref:Rab3 GTPase-activating protein catalytic subunit n=1 Tax=Smittium megazygosporum TaxID=133381 RepID=A0A2T9YCS5_9FUNG|nr:hypothetical protein BB560_006238 [Smittium megazygosporum]
MDDEQYEIIDYTSASPFEALVSKIETILLNWDISEGKSGSFNANYDLDTLLSILYAESVPLNQKTQAALNWSTRYEPFEYVGEFYYLLFHRHPSFEKAATVSTSSHKPNPIELSFPHVYVRDKASQINGLNEIDGLVDSNLISFHPLHRWAGVPRFISVWSLGPSLSVEPKLKTVDYSDSSQLAKILSLDNNSIPPNTAKLLLSALNVASTNLKSSLPYFIPVGSGWNYSYSGKQIHNITLNIKLKNPNTGYIAHPLSKQDSPVQKKPPSSNISGTLLFFKNYETLKSLQITPDLNKIYGLYNAFITRFNIPNCINSHHHVVNRNHKIPHLNKTYLSALFSYIIVNKYNKSWNERIDGFSRTVNFLNVGPMNDPLRQLGLASYFPPCDIVNYIDQGSSSTNQLYLKNASVHQLSSKFLDFSRDRTMLAETLSSFIRSCPKNNSDFDIVLEEQSSSVPQIIFFESFLSSLVSIFDIKQDCKNLQNIELVQETFQDLGVSTKSKNYTKALYEKSNHGTFTSKDSILYKFCLYFIDSFVKYSNEKWHSPHWIVFFDTLWKIMLLEFRFRWENNLLIPDCNLFSDISALFHSPSINLKSNILQQKIEVINNCIARKTICNDYSLKSMDAATKSLYSNTCTDLKNTSIRFSAYLKKRLSDSFQTSRKSKDEFELFSPPSPTSGFQNPFSNDTQLPSSNKFASDEIARDCIDLTHEASEIIDNKLSQSIEISSTKSINIVKKLKNKRQFSLNNKSLIGNKTHIDTNRLSGANSSFNSAIASEGSFEFFNSYGSASPILIQNSKNRASLKDIYTYNGSTHSLKSLKNATPNEAKELKRSLYDHDNQSFVDCQSRDYYKIEYEANVKGESYVDLNMPSSFNSNTSEFFVVANESPKFSFDNIFEPDNIILSNQSVLESMENVISDIKTTPQSSLKNENLSSATKTVSRPSQDHLAKISGRASIIPGSYILGSDPPEPIWIPVTQLPSLFTEDMLLETEAMLVNMGDSEKSSDLRAKLFSKELLSDMEAFKAANPNSTLVDFIRWHSPRDWIVEGKTSTKTRSSIKSSSDLVSDIKTISNNTTVHVNSSESESGGSFKSVLTNKFSLGSKFKSCTDLKASELNPDSNQLEAANVIDFVDSSATSHADLIDRSCEKGRLSLRMSEKNNLWQKLWDKAKSVPASKQVPIFDYETEGRKALEYLENMDTYDVFTMLFPTMVSIVYDGFLSQEIIENLPVLKEHAEMVCSELSSISFSTSHIRRYVPKTKEDLKKTSSFPENPSTRVSLDVDLSVSNDNSGSNYSEFKIESTIEFPKISLASKKLVSDIELLKTAEVYLGRAVSLLRLLPGQYDTVNEILENTEIQISRLKQKKAVLKALSSFGIGSYNQPTRREFVLTSNYTVVNLPVDIGNVSKIKFDGKEVYSEKSLKNIEEEFEILNGENIIDEIKTVARDSSSFENKSENLDNISSESETLEPENDNDIAYPLYRMYASIEEDGRARFVLSSSALKSNIFFAE